MFIFFVFPNTQPRDKANDNCVREPGLSLTADTEPGLYRVLADYSALSDRELSMQEEEVVELIKVGCGGWWYVR